MHNAKGRLEALARAQDALLSVGGNLDRLFDIIVGQSIAAIPQAQGAIVEMLDAGDLIYRAASGNARRLIGQRLPAVGSFAGRSIAADAAMVVADLEQETEIDLARYRDIGMRALIAVPFRRGDESVGALKFYSGEPAAFAEPDLAVARLIAGQLVGGLAAIHAESVNREQKEANAHYQAISDTLPQLIWTMTTSGKPVGRNRRAYHILRIDRLEDAGASVMSLFDHDLAELDLDWERARAQLAPLSFECRLAMPSGSSRWFLINLAPITTEGRESEWLGIGTDIDDLKTLEISLENAVQAQELLLVEVNHRAKNSLQIITGLLAMHASKITHPEAKARLMDARAQIGTIARVYETIYLASQNDHVEFVDFIRNLATSLIGGGGNKRAELVFDVPDVLMLPIRRGVPVALIAGEIITNAIKHATARDDARIAISIHSDEHEYVVDIADNGPGLPADFNPERSAGLGMDIVFGLTKQIGGEVTIDRGHRGARFMLRLPH